MHPRNTWTRRCVLGLLCLSGILPAPAAAQASDRTVVRAAGEQYRAGTLHRLILGRHYRDLWTAPIEVAVLDLDAFAGGLTPTGTGGGQQTRSLRFDGADGREYACRGVDKDPSAVLDSLLQETVVDDLVQDGISAAHPFGALVASPLLDAVGVLHVDPRLVVVPDDPVLGEYREEFAGLLCMIEERPDENAGQRETFQGTTLVISSERLTERLAEGPADSRVDASAFLTARLMDVFLGDWDRHRGQWRWATYDRDEPRTWVPVPRDRDQAFSKFDGLATRVVSLYMPQFVRFEDEYPSITRLHWNARALDRWFLAALERAEWDRVGERLQSALTDDVIAAAVRRLPPEIQSINGEELAGTLRARRDRLHEAWDAFYGILADKVDVQLSDADEVVVVSRSEPGVLTVSASLPGRPPFFQRRFLDDETSEVRIHLEDGDDRIEFGGASDVEIAVRVVGGDGDDTYAFAGAGAARRVRLYDSKGDHTVTGAGAPEVDTSEFEEWEWTEEDRDQPRDWGRRALPIFWTTYSTDLGLFVGGGARLESYSFRELPYSRAIDVRAGFAPQLGKGRAEIDARFNTENSPVFWTLGARVSRLDVLHYYGGGNGTVPAGSESFHRVDQTALSVSAGLGVSPRPGVTLTGGVLLERLSTRDGAGRFFATLGPLYGGDRFIQAGGTARLVVDPLRDSETAPSRARLTLDGAVYPELFDVQRSFARAGAEVSTLLAPSTSPVLSVALRAGARSVWGRVPWHQAAFLGGTTTIRGWDDQRFAGDASLFGSAEARLRVLRPRVVVPVSMGVFGFVDTGRVYVNGASPGGWHSGVGGGLWFQPIRQPYIFRAGAGVGPEATKLFFLLGLPY